MRNLDVLLVILGALQPFLKFQEGDRKVKDWHGAQKKHSQVVTMVVSCKVPCATFTLMKFA